ncbi:MAG: hypothetical protein DRP84_08235 [Spirochaetes bacterium]|nr:MAG: hypothetical protein DRP84_08235 [Spirochaetota bacterium]
MIQKKESEKRERFVTLRHFPIHPLSRNEEITYFFENSERQEEALKLVNDIKNLDTGSFMISGYRGAGKTSFINYVTNLLDDKNFLIARMTLSHTCEAKDFVLRLIRTIRDTIYDNPELIKKVKANQDCKFYIDQAYFKSFYEIHAVVKEGIKEVAKNVIIAESSLEAVGKYMSSVVGGKDLGNEEEPPNESEPNMGSLGNQSKTPESESSLGFLGYDYELAEYEFRKIIEKITKKSELFEKVVFVIDEVDKLDYGEAVGILKNMRTLLLTQNTIFIFIGSKKFNSEWVAAKTFHKDTPLDSLFTRVIYIPLMSIEEIIKTYKKLKGTDEEIKGDEKILLHHVIFKSGGSPRDFFRYLRDFSKWDKTEKGTMVLYLEYGEYSQELFKLHSNIVDIIKRFEEIDKPKGDLSPEYVEAKEIFAFSLFEDLLFNHGLVFTSDDVWSSYATENYKEKAFREGFLEAGELIADLLKVLNDSDDIITKRGKYYFMKDSALAERAKKEKIVRSKISGEDNRTLLDLLDELH